VPYDSILFLDLLPTEQLRDRRAQPWLEGWTHELSDWRENATGFDNTEDLQFQCGY